MCDAGYQGVKDIYLTDLGGSSSASTTRNIGGSSTVISNGSPFLTFIPEAKCTQHPDQCLSYCENTCLRTVTYEIDPASTQGYKLRVCRSDDPGRCTETEETYWYRDEDDEFETLMYNTRAERPRYFTATLPRGSYRAEFLDTSGKVVWPSFVIEKYEKAMCSNALEEGAVEVVVPQVGDAECNSLIKNGNAEASITEHKHWLHRRGGITLRPGQGIGGSNAFATIEDDSTRFDSIAQYLDTRCLSVTAGMQYEINAWIKLVDEKGVVEICDPEKDDCPQVGLYGRSSNGTEWDGQPFATVVPYIRDGDYQLVQGLLDVVDEIASASSVLFYIRRNTRRLTMFVDNVSVRIPGTFDPSFGGSGGDSGGGISEEPEIDVGGDDSSGSEVSAGGGSGGNFGGGSGGGTGGDSSGGGSGGDSSGGGSGVGPGGDSDGESWARPGTMSGISDGMCGNFVLNGDFSDGTTSLWADKNDQELTLVSPGYRGVSDLALSSFEGQMEHKLQQNGFRFGMNYITSGRFRLLDADGKPMMCEKEMCPKMILKLNDLGEDFMHTVAQVLGEPRSANWAILLGGFAADESHVGAESISVQFVSIQGHLVGMLQPQNNSRAHSIPLVLSLTYRQTFPTALLSLWTRSLLDWQILAVTHHLPLLRVPLQAAGQSRW